MPEVVPTIDPIWWVVNPEILLILAVEFLVVALVSWREYKKP